MTQTTSASKPTIAPSKRQPTLVMHKLPARATLFWLTGAVRMHADGSSYNDVWRAWHPLTWLLLLLLIPVCAVQGERLFSVIQFRPSKFWQDNSNQLQWVTPFTKLSSVKPFVLPRSQPRAVTGASTETVA